MSLSNGWTGGQYSLFRAVLGTYLFVHFVQLVRWGAEVFSNAGMLPAAELSPLYPLFPNLLFVFDGPWLVTGLLVVATALCIPLAIGWWDRAAALLLWYVWACLFSRNPLISNPSLPFVGWLLLAHALMPPAPYGSWAARGRADPGGGWRFPGEIFAAVWIVMACGYSYSGFTKLVSPSWLDGTALLRVLENPLARTWWGHDLLLALPRSAVEVGTWGALALELFYAPIACFARLRRLLWLSMLAMHVSLLTLIDFADLSLGMLMIHFFAFDPAWVRPSEQPAPATLFYDGSCGLCHRAVRFLLAEDRGGSSFRFAPLGGAAFESAIPAPQRAQLPDSIVLRCPDGRVLVRSAALLEAGRALGGCWRVIAVLLHPVPPRFLDRVYDFVAARRRRLFAAPAEACPIISAELRGRFSA